MSTSMGVRSAGLLLLTAVITLAGCNKDPFLITSVPDGASTDGGPSTDADGQVNNTDADGHVGDGGGDSVDGCVPGVEVCDGKDDDCNGKIDDVDPTTLITDVKNCGQCGNACTFINAFAKCENAKCVLDKCAPGYYDINKSASDGCEYQCLPTNGGVELCDGVDNDCDNKVDEDFDTQTDIDNCGKCGNRCLYNKAGASCVAGKCVMGTCDSGYADLNKNDKDGCEYKCPVFPTVTETCNGQDDNCNGQIDEGLPGAGVACDTGQLGECKAGITQCQNGAISCVAQNTSQPEVCDGKDNDCDGKTDEDFALQTNPLHCGQCGKVCSYANATPACVAGQCQLAACIDGYRDLNKSTSDGCEHKCEVFPLSVEKCNGKDDDCDGQVDEDFNLQTDVNNCGTCGKRCSYPNAAASCSAGQCAMGKCNTNYYDIKNGSADGCEYFCVPTNGGVEICDNADNDCNGKIDDGFNLAADVNNCGTCNNVCTFNNATAACVGGKCLLSQCKAGYRNIDTINANGCEYKCPVWPPATTDGCDGIDNDCDGQIDEDFQPTSCGSSTGECVAGQNACIGGNVYCQNQTGPTPEICDNKDNDCDGTVDNGFDKLNDPRTCGPTCTQCSIPHAIANCTNGVCGIAVCENGWVDLDKNVGNGCEYNCTPTGVEICDGIDNDCNGKTDSADPGLVLLSGNPCIQVGACNGANATCQGAAGWVCNYSSSVQLKTCTSNAECLSGYCNTSLGVCPGEVATEETRCDNADNDCDGLVDEPFSNKGQACYEQGKQGICQGTGFYVCNAAQTATECNITTPGASPQNELCNGKDDDCDGLVDEETNDASGLGVVDDMVRIQRIYNSVSYDFWIYRYEASRPDASSSAAGANTARSCSKASVIPWANVDYATAQAACAASGKRLCTGIEWFLACSGAPVTDPTCNTTPNDGCYWPYGDTYSTTACNGTDNQVNDAVLPTGSKARCVSQGGMRDLSGNLREWTNDPAYKQCSSNSECNGSCVSGQCSPVEVVGHTVRGGAYDTASVGLRCDFTFAVMPPAFSFPNLGFRCCSDTAP